MSDTKQDGIRILGMVAENYKRLRLVEVAPKGRMVTFSGKPDQGKTSCIDAFLSAIGGKRYTQEVPVRKGAKTAKIRLALGSSKVEWMVQRTIATDGTQTLVLTDAKGVQQGRGQAILDDLRGDIWMDPTEFVRMKPKEQVEILRKVSKLELDVDGLNQQNAEDFEERTAIGREVRRLEAELGGMTVQEGLPAEKVDEAAIMAQLGDVGSANDEARRVDAEKAQLGSYADLQKRELEKMDSHLAQLQKQIAETQALLDRLKDEFTMAKDGRVDLAELAQDALDSFRNAPAGEFADVSALTSQLQEAQLQNREIDKRERRKAKEAELNGKRREAETLTRAIDGRNEKKAAALANAKMPVEGLTFDEDQVLMNGIPLAQLGEAQQIRICTRIAMAENPKLRVLPIMHGESLGEEGIAMLAEMAEEHDFQILMAMVDESGKRGYVIEDGMVKSENTEA